MAKFRVIVEKGAFDSGLVAVDSERLHHLRDVLRIRIGDIGEIVIEGESILDVRIIEIRKDGLLVDVIESHPALESRGLQLSLVQALPKGDKMSEILRMCSEIGVCEFFPVISERSVSIPKDGAKKRGRWQKVIDCAALQSQQLSVPTLGSVQGFQDFLAGFSASSYDLCLVLWEDESVALKEVLESYASPQKILVFVGPEGGLSSDEVAALKAVGFFSVSLGASILRVEHAGFFGMAQLLYEYG